MVVGGDRFQPGFFTPIINMLSFTTLEIRGNLFKRSLPDIPHHIFLETLDFNVMSKPIVVTE